MRSANETLITDGNGLWSKVVREVKITGLEFNDYSFDDEDGLTLFGELRVYFDTKTWDVSEHGLIYTDGHFLADLKDYLVRAGYNAASIDYSECGMQGNNYASFDVGAEFINSWKEKYAA